MYPGRSIFIWLATMADFRLSTEHNECPSRVILDVLSVRLTSPLNPNDRTLQLRFKQRPTARRNPMSSKDADDIWCYPGSKPFDLNTGAAVGPVRNWMSDFATSGALEPAPIPAEKIVTLVSSPGSGPTNCAPATGTISEVCATPISASPLATTSAAWAPGTKIVFDFSWSAIPRRSTTCAK